MENDTFKIKFDLRLIESPHQLILPRFLKMCHCDPTISVMTAQQLLCGCLHKTGSDNSTLVGGGLLRP